MDIEIKDPGIEPAVAAVVDHLGMADEVVISSFFPASLAAMRVAAPHLRRWLLSPGWTDATLATALELGVVGVAPRHPAVDAPLVASARQHGLAVVTWTANAEADLRRLLALGLDAIITDFPGRALVLRAR